jgi:hypothetical protein
MSDLAYFYLLKDEARRRTIDALNKRILRSGGKEHWRGVTLCSITGQDIGDALKFSEEEWPKYYGTDTHLGFSESWSVLNYRYWPRKDHFDLAIWQEVDGMQVLVALAIGNPSHNRTHLTIKWIERFYGPNYLGGRALIPILTCAEEYATLLGCARVLIKDPVDTGKYERYGYKTYKHPDVPHGGDYLAKELEL